MSNVAAVQSDGYDSPPVSPLLPIQGSFPTHTTTHNANSHEATRSISDSVVPTVITSRPTASHKRRSGLWNFFSSKEAPNSTSTSSTARTVTASDPSTLRTASRWDASNNPSKDKATPQSGRWSTRWSLSRRPTPARSVVSYTGPSSQATTWDLRPTASSVVSAGHQRVTSNIQAFGAAAASEVDHRHMPPRQLYGPPLHRPVSPVSIHDQEPPLGSTAADYWRETPTTPPVKLISPQRSFVSDLDRHNSSTTSSLGPDDSATVNGSVVSYGNDFLVPQVSSSDFSRTDSDRPSQTLPIQSPEALNNRDGTQARNARQDALLAPSLLNSIPDKRTSSRGHENSLPKETHEIASTSNVFHDSTFSSTSVVDAMHSSSPRSTMPALPQLHIPDVSQLSRSRLVAPAAVRDEDEDELYRRSSRHLGKGAADKKTVSPVEDSPSTVLPIQGSLESHFWEHAAPVPPAEPAAMPPLLMHPSEVSVSSAVSRRTTSLLDTSSPPRRPDDAYDDTQWTPGLNEITVNSSVSDWRRPSNRSPITDRTRVSPAVLDRRTSIGMHQPPSGASHITEQHKRNSTWSHPISMLRSPVSPLQAVPPPLVSRVTESSLDFQPIRESADFLLIPTRPAANNEHERQQFLSAANVSATGHSRNHSDQSSTSAMQRLIDADTTPDIRRAAVIPVLQAGPAQAIISPVDGPSQEGTMPHVEDEYVPSAEPARPKERRRPVSAFFTIPSLRPKTQKNFSKPFDPSPKSSKSSLRERIQAAIVPQSKFAAAKIGSRPEVSTSELDQTPYSHSAGFVNGLKKSLSLSNRISVDVSKQASSRNSLFFRRGSRLSRDSHVMQQQQPTSTHTDAEVVPSTGPATRELLSARRRTESPQSLVHRISGSEQSIQTALMRAQSERLHDSGRIRERPRPFSPPLSRFSPTADRRARLPFEEPPRGDGSGLDEYRQRRDHHDHDAVSDNDDAVTDLSVSYAQSIGFWESATLSTERAVLRDLVEEGEGDGEGEEKRQDRQEGTAWDARKQLEGEDNAEGTEENGALWREERGAPANLRLQTDKDVLAGATDGYDHRPDSALVVLDARLDQPFDSGFYVP